MTGKLADQQTLDYALAVKMADQALAAILAERPRPTGVYSAQEVNAFGTAFYDWLCERPDVAEVLSENDPYGGLEPTHVEAYIEIHSAAFRIALGDMDETQGCCSARISRKVAH